MRLTRRALWPLAALPAAGPWLFGGVALLPHPVDAAHLGDAPGAPLWSVLDRVAAVGTPVGPVFDPEVEALDGAAVTLAGFMLVSRPAERHGRFVLTPRRLGCPACARPGPGSLVAVRLVDAMAETDTPIVLRGRLHLRRLSTGIVYGLDRAAPVRA